MAAGLDVDGPVYDGSGDPGDPTILGDGHVDETARLGRETSALRSGVVTEGGTFARREQNAPHLKWTGNRTAEARVDVVVQPLPFASAQP